MGRVSTCQKNCNTIDLRRAQVNHNRPARCAGQLLASALYQWYVGSSLCFLLYFSYVFYFVYSPDRVLHYCSGVAQMQSFRPMAMRLSSEGRIAIGWGAASASYRNQGCRAQHNNALWVGPASGQYRCWADQHSSLGKIALCIVCNFLFCV